MTHFQLLARRKVVSKRQTRRMQRLTINSNYLIVSSVAMKIMKKANLLRETENERSKEMMILRHQLEERVMIFQSSLATRTQRKRPTLS